MNDLLPLFRGITKFMYLISAFILLYYADVGAGFHTGGTETMCWSKSIGPGPAGGGTSTPMQDCGGATISVSLIQSLPVKEGDTMTFTSTFTVPSASNWKSNPQVTHANLHACPWGTDGTNCNPLTETAPMIVSSPVNGNFNTTPGPTSPGTFTVTGSLAVTRGNWTIMGHYIMMKNDLSVQYDLAGGMWFYVYPPKALQSSSTTRSSKTSSETSSGDTAGILSSTSASAAGVGNYQASGSSPSSNHTVGLAVGLSIGLTALAIGIVLGVIYFRRRRQLHDDDPYLPHQMENGIPAKKGVSKIKVPKFPGVSKPFPNAIETTSEITHSILVEIPDIQDVRIQGKLGEGNFGVVYKGLWGALPIALKQITSFQLEECRDEASILLRLKHPNCVLFLGYHTSAEKIQYIVTEFMENGSLVDYLRKHPRIEEATLIRMALDAANGMTYLASCNIIHRDLAARNLLVDASLKVKVADFGLSRLVKDENYYVGQSNKAFPVRWSAPESLKFNLWTTNSDLWSFAIVLWEIFSQGMMPYTGKSNSEVVYLITKEQYRLPQDDIPDEIYKLMRQLQDEDPHKRGNFEEISQKLKEILHRCLGETPSLPPKPQYSTINRNFGEISTTSTRPVKSSTRPVKTSTLRSNPVNGKTTLRPKTPPRKVQVEKKIPVQVEKKVQVESTKVHDSITPGKEEVSYDSIAPFKETQVEKPIVQVEKPSNIQVENPDSGKLGGALRFLTPKIGRRQQNPQKPPKPPKPSKGLINLPN
eukprot:TRINITY_DN2832_c0_g1_i2.p1 TRINITY_DN2832_c0_g1~~TRINITY_DN2832_c0_g1_i2.p1  ORF type:complete len:760 (+),score=226.49 TRINITY_DN2832_c0_g1_i2:800-3079(+)